MKNLLTQSYLGLAPAGVEGVNDWQSIAGVRDFAPSGNARPARNRPDFDFSRILVPVALSDASEAGLAVARDLARDFGAEPVLLHVVQLNIIGEERGIQRTRLTNELCRDAELELRRMAKAVGIQPAIEVVVAAGRPAETIVETARRLKVAGIILCKHDHKRWLKWLHRNTASTVMRQAPCPVWLISPGGAKVPSQPTRHIGQRLSVPSLTAN
jgi:nucleotide-binding universal stress UspA family protein